MTLIWITICSALRVALGSNGKVGIVGPRDFKTDWYFVISIHFTTGIGTINMTRNTTFLCTGTILTHKVAMTTKSCIKPYKMYQLKINSNSYKVNMRGKWYESHYTVDDRFFHPKYDFALLGVFPEFKRQLGPSMFPPYSRPTDDPRFWAIQRPCTVDCECRTAGFGPQGLGEVHGIESTKHLLYQTLKIKFPAKSDVSLSNRPEILWGQICYGDNSPFSLLILTQRLLGTVVPGGPLICTIHGEELLVGMSLLKREKKCVIEFLNLSYLMKEIRKFLKANPARTQPRRNGNDSLTAINYQTFAVYAILRILF